MIGKVRLVSRGPGGRAMRKDRKSWALIATYFQPAPSIKALQRIAALTVHR